MFAWLWEHGWRLRCTHTLCSLMCVSVVACVACKLRPCPSYSRRRDRINLVLWRGLSAERWKVQQYIPTDRRMPSSSISRRSRGTNSSHCPAGRHQAPTPIVHTSSRRREAPPQIGSVQGALRHPPAPLPGVITDVRAVIIAVPPPQRVQTRFWACFGRRGRVRVCSMNPAFARHWVSWGAGGSGQLHRPP